MKILAGTHIRMCFLVQLIALDNMFRTRFAGRFCVGCLAWQAWFTRQYRDQLSALGHKPYQPTSDSSPRARVRKLDHSTQAIFEVSQSRTELLRVPDASVGIFITPVGAAQLSGTSAVAVGPGPTRRIGGSYLCTVNAASEGQLHLIHLGYFLCLLGLDWSQ